MGINLKKTLKNHLTKTKLSICWQNGKLITDYDGNKKLKKNMRIKIEGRAVLIIIELIFLISI